MATLIQTKVGQTKIAIVTAQDALPFPPIDFGDVTRWNADDGTMPQFDLRIWSDVATTLTAAELFGGTLEVGTISATAITSSTHASNLFTLTAHGLETGSGPIRLTTSGTLPAGLALATDYYVIKLSSSTFSLAETRALALARTAIDFTSDGTGTHTFTGQGTHYRMHWMSHGFLGPAAGGVVTLTAAKGYRVRCAHNPNILAYAISATLSVQTPVNASVSAIITTK